MLKAGSHACACMTLPVWIPPILEFSSVAGLLGVGSFVLFERPFPQAKLLPRHWLYLALLLSPVAVLMFTDNHYVGMVDEQKAALAAAGIALGLMGTTAARRGATRNGVLLSKWRRRFWLVGGALFVLYGVFEGVVAAIDLLMPLRPVVGVVVSIEPSRQNGRTIDPANINIGDRRYYATMDIEPLFHVGDQVDIEVGAASHYILAIRSVSPP